MKKIITKSALVLVHYMLVSFVMALGKKSESPPVHPIKQYIPSWFPEPVCNFKYNPSTEEGVALGRELFYEPRLSKDGNFACASCHQQFAAFADFDHNLSHGFNNSFTTRNAPPLFNLAWQKELHLDGSINHLEVQPLAPITAPNEMAQSLDSIITLLQKDNMYRRKFKSAFGDSRVTSQRMLRALAQFTGTIVSADSRYDKMK